MYYMVSEAWDLQFCQRKTRNKETGALGCEFPTGSQHTKKSVSNPVSCFELSLKMHQDTRRAPVLSLCVMIKNYICENTYVQRKHESISGRLQQCCTQECDTWRHSEPYNTKNTKKHQQQTALMSHSDRWSVRRHALHLQLVSVVSIYKEVVRRNKSMPRKLSYSIRETAVRAHGATVSTVETSVLGESTLSKQTATILSPTFLCVWWLLLILWFLWNGMYHQ